MDESAILELGRTPIPGDHPCGTDLADAENYLYVQAELGKLDRVLEDDAPPDWVNIERRCVSILGTQSKDLTIASALGLAFARNHGYGGLAAWLGLVLELVNNFWEDLFPARLRRRKARIESVPYRFAEGGWFREIKPSPSDRESLELCQQRIADLEIALSAKMPDTPPDFREFVRQLKDRLSQLGRPAPATGSRSQSATGGGGGAAPIEDAASANRAVLMAVGVLRKADPTDPLAYVLIRGVKWRQIELPPPGEGRSTIPPPDAQLMESVNVQYKKQFWEPLLKTAEDGFKSSDPLWLDLQYYVCAAMRGLGPQFDKARRWVETLTAGLLTRLGDELCDLQFRGGTPLCNGETRTWIEADLVNSPNSGQHMGEAGTNGELSEATQTARGLVASGKLKEALKTLRQGLSGCTQRRDRFLWRMQIAQLCVDAQRFQLAAPLLEDCTEEVRRLGIDEWEPSLAIDVATALYRCRKSVAAVEKAPTSEMQRKVSESFAWLCQLDPVAALSAEPSAG